MERERRCATCRFWDSDGTTRYHDDPSGICRRYPPVGKDAGSLSLASPLPLVTVADCWCGEWQQGKPTADDGQM